MRYAIYFRETVTKRCHLAITDVPNARRRDRGGALNL